MIVVSDTSPIVNLAGIAQLELLPSLFGEVIIPQQVYEEIVVRGHGKPGAQEIQTATWVQVRSCSDPSLIARFDYLDPGEAEAIALAIELGADSLIIDEQLGREAAFQVHLQVIGVLGILLRAKAKGLISHVTPNLDALIEFGFYVDSVLYARVRSLAGE